MRIRLQNRKPLRRKALTVVSFLSTHGNEKKDSEIADFRVPFPCSMSTVMLDLNPSNSTGLGS